MTQLPLLVEKKREALKQALMALGEEVERALRQSLDALRRGDLALARDIVDGDAAIDRERRLLEQETLLVLAAYQPAGFDLRMIGASLEMVGEIERIADYGADVARILICNAERTFPVALVERIAAMGDGAVSMFADAMTAYGRGGDEALARAVAARDDEVDAWQREAVDAVMDLIRANPEEAAPAVALSWVAHNYERVADRATNIAERVVYIATGETPDLD
jgi:phosphate transport system protein